MPVFLIVVPGDGVMAAIFKDGRQKGIKLPILNVRVGVLDTSDTNLTKNAHRICSPFWYSYSVWLMDYNWHSDDQPISRCGAKRHFARVLAPAILCRHS